MSVLRPTAFAPLQTVSGIAIPDGVPGKLSPLFKQEKQIKGIQQNIEDAMRNTQQDITWFRNDLNDRFRDIHQRIEDSFENSRNMSNAYTDMRIDKLEDKLSGNSTKKLIKG